MSRPPTRCRHRQAIATITIAWLLQPGCGGPPAIPFSAAERAAILELSPVPPPPPSPTNRVADDPRAVALGRQLFYDPRLSGDGSVSCATCHDPELGWSDGRPRSRGRGDTRRHALSLWNVAHSRWLFWDGRADSLWAQVRGPLEAANEMGSSRARLARLIYGDPQLRAAYEELFGSLAAVDAPLPEDAGPSDPAWAAMSVADRARTDRILSHLGKAIEAFERTIRSDDAPFDRFVAGVRRGNRQRVDALAPAAQRGLALFIGRGQCTLCHAGPLFTDGEFHNIGLPPRPGTAPDLGRFDGVTTVLADPFNGRGEQSDDRSVEANLKLRYLAQQPHNLGELKTPSLRNVATTAPYMHDGRFATLAEVVQFYSRLDGQAAIGHREESLRPLGLTDSEVADLVAFLVSLTGEPPTASLRKRTD